ncbi:ankyrin repeat domain-containing protein [Streptomyces sp. NPDC002611]
MINMEWDGLTDRDRYGDWYLKARDRFSDLARDADWSGLFGELEENPRYVNLARPGSHSGFAPLHQAAWHGATIAVVSRLLAHGAWRTHRSRDGRLPVDIARERGHTHLLELLESVAIRRLPTPSDVLEHHFHAMLRERTGSCFDKIKHLLPPLSPLTESRDARIFFRVAGMMGGFHYRLQADTVHVHRSSRMDADNGEFYQVTPDGWTKLPYSPRPPAPWSFPY